MGEAKRRAQAQRAMLDQLAKADLARLSAAVRKLCVAASSQFGVDCVTHAKLGIGILDKLGIEARLVIGEAAWRVGMGNGDVIAHMADLQGPGQDTNHYYAYHAWIEVAGNVLDLTTYQLPYKASELDALDGQHTTVDWAPDYIYSNKQDLSTYQSVAQGNTGQMHYREDRAMARKVLAMNGENANHEDVELAWTIYQMPEVVVIGPNHV